MTIEVERDSPRGRETADGSLAEVTNVMRRLARWLYRRLEQMADSSIDDALGAQSWVFTAKGVFFPV